MLFFNIANPAAACTSASFKTPLVKGLLLLSIFTARVTSVPQFLTENDEDFGEKIEICTDSLVHWVKINREFCGIMYPYPETMKLSETLKMELDAGCGKLGEKCRLERAEAFGKVESVCDREWTVYLPTHGESSTTGGGDDDEEIDGIFFPVSRLLSKTNIVEPQSPECTIKNPANQEYCVINFMEQVESGCLSDKGKCTEEDELARVCNR
jgi:hypothetical protein